MKRYVITLLSLMMLAGSVAAQKDITTEYIVNAALANGTTGWTVKNFNNPVRGTNTGTYAVEAYAGWSSLSVTSYSLTQKIKLPKGSYRLTNNAFFRYGEKYNTNASKSQAYLKAGTKRVAVKTLGSVTADTYADNQADGADCLGNDTYRNVVEFDVASDNTTIEIGITGTFDKMRSWCITGGFELTDLNAKDDRKGLLAALERFENDYNLADGTDYGRLSMSAEAWTSLIKKVNTACLALDDNTRAGEYSDLRDDLNAQMDATDASIALFNEYEAVVDQVKTLVGASASLPVYPSDTDNDVSLRAAIDRLKKYAENYKGDVNGDGVVDVADIASIIDIMAGNGQSSMGSGQQSADVNGDGTVDVADIAMVISIMAGSH